MKVKKREINTESELRATLDEMYKLAKEKDEPFYDLIELMLNEQVIMTAVHNIKSNRGSNTAGIDGKTINEYLQMPYEKLIKLVRDTILDYNPKPVKRKFIPKANSNKLRPLGIPVMIDRIIQEITRIVIEPIAEAKFYHYSFGFRPMRSPSQAMAEILERIRRNKTYWVIEGDIKSFFDNINHNKLIAMLWKIGVKDKRVLAIIKKMLRSGVIEEDGRLYRTEVGSPQGGIISPLLANIYLNHFDWMIAKEFQEHLARYKVADPSRIGPRFVRRRHQDAYLIRYADDWVILCKTEEQAKTLLTKVKKYFKHRLSIELSIEKTLITDIRTKRAKFLGYEFFAEKARGKHTVVGKMIPNVAKATGKVAAINKEIRKLVRLKHTRERALQIEKINGKIVSLAEYYSITNCSKFFKAWDNRISFQQHKTFKKLNGGKGRFRTLTKRACTLDNRVTRHMGRQDRLYYLEIDDIEMGITKFSFTKSVDAMKVHTQLSPYTMIGRGIYQRNNKKLPLLREGSVYDYHELADWVYFMEVNQNRKKPYYNFEYVMNREYAYIRDRGQCKCCKLLLTKGFRCHHIDPTLPIDKINKVSNLASLCMDCHVLVHNEEDVFKLVDKKTAQKIIKYRSHLLIAN